MTFMTFNPEEARRPQYSTVMTFNPEEASGPQFSECSTLTGRRPQGLSSQEITLTLT